MLQYAINDPKVSFERVQFRFGVNTKLYRKLVWLGWTTVVMYRKILYEEFIFDVWGWFWTYRNSSAGCQLKERLDDAFGCSRKSTLCLTATSVIRALNIEPWSCFFNRVNNYYPFSVNAKWKWLKSIGSEFSLTIFTALCIFYILILLISIFLFISVGSKELGKYGNLSKKQR